MSASPPLRHRLTFPSPHTHDVEVETRLETSGRTSVELALAVWTPGSYLVREYARHVEGFRAELAEGGLAWVIGVGVGLGALYWSLVFALGRRRSAEIAPAICSAMSRASSSWFAYCTSFTGRPSPLSVNRAFCLRRRLWPIN